MDDGHDLVCSTNAVLTHIVISHFLAPEQVVKMDSRRTPVGNSVTLNGRLGSIPTRLKHISHQQVPN